MFCVRSNKKLEKRRRVVCAFFGKLDVEIFGDEQVVASVDVCVSVVLDTNAHALNELRTSRHVQETYTH
jgi:hypothetical protein